MRTGSPPPASSRVRDAQPARAPDAPDAPGRSGIADDEGPVTSTPHVNPARAPDAVTRFEGEETRRTTHTLDRENAPLSPPQGSSLPHGSRPFELLANAKSMAAGRAWDPVRRLPPELQARLGPDDCARIMEAVASLQRQVRERKLDHVPVFGYLSLRTHNHAELGKARQSDVVIGRDVVPASLPGHDIDVVASSVFRGTPEHPGAVAGLAPRAGAQTPGVILKLPLARAEELLAVVLARELFAEGDLHDGMRADGSVSSNAMYIPVVTDVVVDGGGREGSVPALVFMTNGDGEKAVSHGNAFGDDKGLTVERMAWLFAGEGGFVDGNGRAAGGATADYWRTSYVEARRAAGQPIDPTIAAALDLSMLLPQQETIDRLLARTDHDARLMVEALRHLFAGAAVPIGIHRAQKDDAGVTRTRSHARGSDASDRLLAVAYELEHKGKIRAE